MAEETGLKISEMERITLHEARARKMLVPLALSDEENFSVPVAEFMPAKYEGLYHDGSMTGDGSEENPLGVSDSIKEGAAAGATAVQPEQLSAAIAAIGKPLVWKDGASVEILNAGIPGIQPGWTYTLTDSGTLTAGSIKVDVGDEVAWTEDDEWFKLGGESSKVVVLPYDIIEHADLQKLIEARQAKKVIILENDRGTGVMEYYYGTNLSYDNYEGDEYVDFTFVNPESGKAINVTWSSYSGTETWTEKEICKIAVFEGTVTAGPSYTFPDESDVRAAVDGGKVVIIKMSGVSGDTWYQSGLKYGSQYIFCDTMNPERQLRLEDLGSGYQWSVFSEPVHNSVVTFTGTLDPDASPVDYSGMPNSIDVANAIANGNEVRLELTNSSGFAVIYRLINGMQYNKIFAAMDGEHIGNGGYVNLIIMSYAGPGNPWHWSVAKALQQALNTQDKTESDISSGHMEIASNNTVTTLTLTTVNAVTMHTSDYSLPPNFAVQIDNTGNSNDVTIDVQHGPDSLKYSVAGGNTVGAGKYMQLTCVGSCWTLAEFTVPTP